jgi:predicted O-linked N-acetylglucosamine transferase (SPINDLY family)
MAGPFKNGADGNAAPACHQRGLELLRGNQPALAIVELEQAVKLDPANAVYLNHLGNARKAAGDLQGALASYRRALEAAPAYVSARYNLGLVLRDLNRTEEAELHFLWIHERDPGDVDVLFNLADICAAQSRFEDSARLYRAAVDRAPEDPYLWLGLATAHKSIPGQLDESMRCLRRCVELMPGLAEAQFLIGNILLDEGRADEAAAHYRKAIESSPGHAEARNNLGNVLLRQGRLDEAIECYRKAIELAPGLALAHLNLGSACSLRGAYDQALESYEAALRLQPDNAAARGCLLFELQRACDWSRFDELAGLQRRSVASRSEDDVVPFHLLSIPSTPQEQLQCARNYAAHRARAVARDRARLSFRFERRPKPRLRIGYLSADFREHPAAYWIAELIELHDRSRFEICGYSYGPDDRSTMRARLQRAFDRFVDLSPLPHADAAAAIHADGVDILLDMGGYTTYSRPEILALRPAPVQVNYLGYPGTMGAEFIDYLVTNSFITPPDRAGDFSEKLVCMPGSYQASDRKRAIEETPPRSALGLPDGAFVFCCHNQSGKILPQVYAVWMRLLAAVPDSVAWLVESNPRSAQNLRREAQKFGVGSKRLVFAPRAPLARYLARMRAADLFLDTFPYNAHSTACDALWVGLPVLTCTGDTFASRVAGSLLNAVGLPELITHTLEEYEALALRLARSPGALAALREKLSRNRLTSTLFDTPGYTRNLESAYLQMWSNFLAGAGPRAIGL